MGDLWRRAKASVDRYHRERCPLPSPEDLAAMREQVTRNRAHYEKEPNEHDRAELLLSCDRVLQLITFAERNRR